MGYRKFVEEMGPAEVEGFDEVQVEVLRRLEVPVSYNSTLAKRVAKDNRKTVKVLCHGLDFFQN